mmetsp:Transcript_4305/g.16087  ORF Transcript_4305/g.16087 Transcript_4305/m.16087 type:complete len:381 (-) Transcript_4305:77-1219(-)
MGLDGVRVFLVRARRGARFDDVGIQGTLHQKLGPHAGLLLHVVLVLLEDLDELRADRLALLLRVRHALELGEEPGGVVNLGHREVQVVLEHLHHAFTLLVPQQAVIHEAAVQPVADGLVHQRRSHRGVHASGQRADDVVIRSHLLVDDGDLLVEDVLHRPPGFNLGDVKEEVADRLEPALGVRHLGVVLKAEDLAIGVLDGHHGARVGLAHAFESLRKLHGFVAVGHPDHLGRVHLLAVERGFLDDVHGHATVLGLVRGLDLAAHELDDELHAVADAEHGDALGLAVIEEGVRDGGRALDVDGVGPAGEDDHGRVMRRDASHVGVARQEDRVHPELAHAPGDELRVLAAVVEDDDGVGAGGAHAALAARLLGGGRAHGVG